MELPIKRKRGRPRKSESSSTHVGTSPTTSPMANSQGSKQIERIPIFGSKSGDENAKITTSSGVMDEMVGQVISGVVEGSFEAGYLLNVQFANNDTYLRGIVFLPEKVAPITITNDVAPHAKMYLRKEIPFPNIYPQNLIHTRNTQPNSVPTSEFKGQKLSSEHILSSFIHHEGNPTKFCTPNEELEQGIKTKGASVLTHGPNEYVNATKKQMLDTISAVECNSITETNKFTRNENDKLNLELEQDQPPIQRNPRPSPLVQLFSDIVPTTETTNQDMHLDDEVVRSGYKANETIFDESNMNLKLTSTSALTKHKPASVGHEVLTQELLDLHRRNTQGFSSVEPTYGGTSKLNLELNQPLIFMESVSASSEGKLINMFPTFDMTNNGIRYTHSQNTMQEIEKNESISSKAVNLNVELKQTQYREPISMGLGPLTWSRADTTKLTTQGIIVEDRVTQSGLTLATEESGFISEIEK